MTCCNSTADPLYLEHTIGARLFFEVTTEEGDDLSAIPHAMVLDSPDGETRWILGYLNGYTEGEISVDNETITFTQTAEWSAENMTEGEWQFRLLKGTADVDLQVIASGVFNVLKPAYGAIDL